MRCASGWLLVACLLLSGCGEPPADVSQAPDAAATPAGDGGAAPAGSTVEPAATGDAADSGTTPAATGEPAAPAAAGSFALTPDNTKITFVGTHAAPKAPDPRTGTFEKFQGTAQIDAETKTLKSVSIEIETGSMKTFNPMLTNHLNSPDFFDTEKYPTAKFETTSIEASEEGKVTITGQLTLLETTKEISFPATVDVTDGQLSLQAEFTINRLDFGLGVDQKGVEPPVALTVVVGQPKAE